MNWEQLKLREDQDTNFRIRFFTLNEDSDLSCVLFYKDGKIVTVITPNETITIPEDKSELTIEDAKRAMEKFVSMIKLPINQIAVPTLSSCFEIYDHHDNLINLCVFSHLDKDFRPNIEELMNNIRIEGIDFI